MKRYVMFAVLFMICACTTMLDFANVTGTITLPLWADYLFCVYFVTSGFFYALIRVQEPAVKAMLRKKFCRRQDSASDSSS